MVRKPKSTPSPAGKPPSPGSSQPANDSKPNPFRFPKFSILAWLGLALALGALIFLNNKQLAGEVILGIVLVLEIARITKQGKGGWLGRWVGTVSPLKLLVLLSILWAGFSLELLTFPTHRWMFPKAMDLPFQYSTWTLFAFFAGLVVVIYLFPPLSSPAEDVPPPIARFLLLLVLGVGSVFVFYHVDTAIGPASEDTIVHTAVGRNVFDVKDYSTLFSANIGNDWPPFVTMFSTLLWHFKPDTPVVSMSRIVSGLDFLAFVLFVYLAGKEAVNRRVGLFAAALAAVSQGLVSKALAGMTGDSHAMAVALVLWLFFRWVRNPKIWNFLLWGAGIAFGQYCYLIFRPLVPFFIFSGLTWILLRQKEERKMEKPLLYVVIATSALFFFYIYYFNRVFASDNSLTRIINASGPWLSCMLLGGYFLLVARYSRQLFALVGRYPYLFGWLGAVWMCIFVSFPKMADPYELWMMQVGNVAGNRPMGGGFKSLSRFSVLFDENGSDYFNLSYPKDPVFGYSETIMGGLGLAWVLAKPNLKSLYILAMFFGTVSIFFITDTPHSLRVMLCFAPLLLLAAFALDQFWSWFCAVIQSRTARIIALVLFLGFLNWTAVAVFDRVCVQWMGRFLYVNVAMYLRALEDQSRGFRVYGGPDFSFTRINNVLYENHPMLLMKPSNLIYYAPGEKPQDVVVYLFKTDPHDMDDIYEKKIHAYFPNAQWQDVRNPFERDEWRMALRCQIPFSDIEAYSRVAVAASKKYNEAQKRFARLPPQASQVAPPEVLFEVLPAPEHYWDRIYFSALFNGLRPGLVDWEDKTAQASDPASPLLNLASLYQPAVEYNGLVHMEKGGSYEVTCKTINRTEVFVDGKKVIDLAFPVAPHFGYAGPEKTQREALSLKAGDHKVKVLTIFERNQTPPDIALRLAGSPGPAQSLWSSFSF
jgi:hypothetical protein